MLLSSWEFKTLLILKVKRIWRISKYFQISKKICSNRIIRNLQMKCPKKLLKMKNNHYSVIVPNIRKRPVLKWFLEIGISLFKDHQGLTPTSTFQMEDGFALSAKTTILVGELNVTDAIKLKLARILMGNLSIC